MFYVLHFSFLTYFYFSPFSSKEFLEPLKLQNIINDSLQGAMDWKTSCEKCDFHTTSQVAHINNISFAFPFILFAFFGFVFAKMINKIVGPFS